MGQIYAVLDLGTSKSTFLIAKRVLLNKLSVMFSETIDSKNAIRRGRVFNLNETHEVISQLIRKLDSNSSLQLEKIYIGIGGQSLHTQSFSRKRIVENGIITNQLLDSLKDEAQKYTPDLEENFGIFSSEYYADGELVSISNLKGITASQLEAKYQLIVGNPCLKLSRENAISKNKIPVAGYLISPIATAEAVLTQEEKESGCALVEFGEGVTYLSVYKNKALKYLVTIPLGGVTITKDIRSLNVSEDEAEELKIKHGSAISNSTISGIIPVNEEKSLSRTIELRNLNWIIEARVNEIVMNVMNQIEKSGYSQQLDAGIVITGGGALLKDLPLFIRNKTGQNVRLAKAKVLINQVEKELSPAESCAIGLAMLGKVNCVKEKKPEVLGNPLPFMVEVETIEKKEPETKGTSIFRRVKNLKNNIKYIFSEEDMDENTQKNTENNNANNNQ